MPNLIKIYALLYNINFSLKTQQAPKKKNLWPTIE
jgi:hypothetical protein